MASTNIYRVPSSTGNQKTFTFSFWWKSSSTGADKCLFSSGSDASNYFMVRTTGAETLQILSKSSGGNQINYATNQSFRDCNGWYHIVLTIDTTQAEQDRVKFYVNGERLTSFSATTVPNQDANVLYVNDTTTHAWGRKNITSDKYLDGCLSHVHFIDGTSYDASAFGSTDSTTGEWKINTSPSVTYGTNGYFIFKDGNSVTDQSGNSNNWQVGNGTLTKTEDNPSNVFATINPLDNATTGTQTYSDGNTTMLTDKQSRTTLGASSGKWYCEAKYVNNTAFNGIAQMDGSNTFNTNSIILFGNNNGEIFVSGSSTDTNVGAGTAIDNNSIIMFAMDLDNNRLYIGKNGSWWTSGAGFNSASLSSYKTITRVTGDSFGFKCSSGSGTSTTSWNFGNGYFGTTAVSSAGTNASGIGIFEYDVPTGFTALSTKGLNL